MDIKHLKSFCVLGETLHFGRAAARLNIVQPALSGHIKQLEQHVGVQLVERSRHHVRLTAAGCDFLKNSREILNSLDRSVESARNVGTGFVGTLRIGAVSSAINLFLARAIRLFEDSWPDVEICLTAIDSCKQIEGIAEGRFDLGFVRMPISQDGITIRTIAQEAFDVCLPHGHPLASRTHLTPRALRGQTILMLARENAPGFHDALSAACHQNGLMPGRIKYFREFTSAVQMASVGLGAAIVPACAMSSGSDGICRLPLDLGSYQSDIGAAWAEPASPLLHNFLASITAVSVATARGAVIARTELSAAEVMAETP
ncbi:LysR family transcriptional regulator [Tanticharoenia sakaeratensis NBRC 103193]|uniref:LysR family transcriptional regulator n=1 Tax=Tanticharoenia sakaeratensis NBRC 103193 TaxID=1231623 RepID=A0A0D6MK79_9PROT|nr:LysR family transcriptional regulator [Tanticharoenia sakaeratensis NBRC 103193]GBQ23781.1 LysR family transcriptional regulator [Tanticharoenia sakaeratensis NBRC 103193]